MQLKTYSADSLRAALRLARVELGADATLVDSKEADGDSGPRYVATFAVQAETEKAERRRTPDGRHWRTFVPPEVRTRPEEQPALEAAPAPAPGAGLGSGATAAAAPARALEAAVADAQPAEPPPVEHRAYAPEQPALRGIVIQLRALQSAVDALRRTEAFEPRAAEPSSAVEQALARLQRAGFDLETWPRLRTELQQEAQAGRNAFELVEWLRRQVSARWNTAASLGALDRPTVTALVGPSGAGKTSSLLKLAVQYGLRRNRLTHLLLADPIRWGSAEAMGAQAEAAGALLTVARGPEQLCDRLERVLEAAEPDELVLIDTPGYGPSEASRAADMAAALAQANVVDVHLTLNAAQGDGELRRAVEAAAVFQPRRLIFTHLDVTTRPGAVWNESSRSGLPISFLGTGPRTPDDLRAANAGRLTNLLFAG
ncbi:MAG: hypothetical protein GC160_09270 [Acidobacteria bacterium]|nr:hypothetical protein [Acidobacteriota bacterium]